LRWRRELVDQQVALSLQTEDPSFLASVEAGLAPSFVPSLAALSLNLPLTRVLSCEDVCFWSWILQILRTHEALSLELMNVEEASRQARLVILRSHDAFRRLLLVAVARLVGRPVARR